MYQKMCALQLCLLTTGLAIHSVSCRATAREHSTHTVCLTAEYCLCVSDATAIQTAIDGKVRMFRDSIHAAHEQGRIVIYLSVPLSGKAGGYFSLNRKIAADISQRLLRRFGKGHVWVLNPATPLADLPNGASQADYMLIWSTVLYGAEQAKDGVDLVYFAGPSDFAHLLGVNGRDELGSLARYFDDLKKSDKKFAAQVNSGGLTLRQFVSYYAFRTSVAFSKGAHDEWNLFAFINQQRRSAGGVTEQLPILFDGRAVAPPLYEETVSAGNVGVCISGGGMP
jgi:hypothetical protein